MTLQSKIKILVWKNLSNQVWKKICIKLANQLSIQVNDETCNKVDIMSDQVESKLDRVSNQLLRQIENQINR